MGHLKFKKGIIAFLFTMVFSITAVEAQVDTSVLLPDDNPLLIREGGSQIHNNIPAVTHIIREDRSQGNRVIPERRKIEKRANGDFTINFCNGGDFHVLKQILGEYGMDIAPQEIAICTNPRMQVNKFPDYGMVTCRRTINGVEAYEPCR